MPEDRDSERIFDVHHLQAEVGAIVSSDLIHRRVRIEFRELCSGWGTLRLISDAFDAEGFIRGPEPEEDTARRGCFNAYANAIDWQDYGQVSRALRVFKEILSWGQDVEPARKRGEGGG